MTKPNLVLDLDQTIISSEAVEEFNFKKYEKKAIEFDFENMDGYYIVFSRPHLQKFLDFAFENFNVSVWTAATKDYAILIIEKILLIKPGRKIDWVFFSFHCDVSEKMGKCTKDLSLLWKVYKIPGFNKNNTVILDDYDDVYKNQRDNSIQAKPFFFTDKGSEKDDFLLTTMEMLKKRFL